MRLDSVPTALMCSVCGSSVDDAVGMAGCAPELDDVIDPVDDGFDVVSVKR